MTPNGWLQIILYLVVHVPAVIILDTGGWDGIEVTRRLREWTRSPNARSS